MKVNEAKEAIIRQSVVHRVDDETRWGVIVSLSDDETTAYYRPNGARYPISALISNLTLDKPFDDGSDEYYSKYLAPNRR